MANLDTTVAQLDASWRTLRQGWEHTRELWDDAVRRSFDEEYWTPLEGQLAATQREMQRLAEVIAQARRHVR